MNNAYQQSKSARPLSGDDSPTISNRISSINRVKANSVDAESQVNREISELQGEINNLGEILNCIYNRIEQVSSPEAPTDTNCKTPCEAYKVVSPVADRIRTLRDNILRMTVEARDRLSRLEI